MPARERLTLMPVFEELRGLGYQGGYDASRRCARKWHREPASIGLHTAGLGSRRGPRRELGLRIRTQYILTVVVSNSAPAAIPPSGINKLE
jgi:hypothetical protein